MFCVHGTDLTSVLCPNLLPGAASWWGRRAGAARTSFCPCSASTGTPGQRLNLREQRALNLGYPSMERLLTLYNCSTD